MKACVARPTTSCPGSTGTWADVRIVVTGALGHIGSALVRSLPRAFPNAEILMVDDLSTQRY